MAETRRSIYKKLTHSNTKLTKSTAPTSGSVTESTVRFGREYHTTFTLTNARIPVTDGGASGSYGSLQLGTFPEGYIHILNGSEIFTAFAEGSALTTGAGDAVFAIGVGTTAVAAAADGTLGATEKNIASISAITNSGGTGTGKNANVTAVNLDGTSTAGKICLNWSGTAATIDANSYIDVTGVVRVSWIWQGDA